MAQNRLQTTYGIKVGVISQDLSKRDAAEKIAEWCISRDLHLKVLCNVAGFGGVDDYPGLPLDTLRYMIDLNLGSCMALTYCLLPLLKKMLHHMSSMYQAWLALPLYHRRRSTRPPNLR